MITKVLGDVPVIKVLDFLQGSIPHDFTMSEIEEHAAVGHTELRRDFAGLLQNNMVVKTRRISGMQLYTLNRDNLIVDAVVDFCKAISIEAIVLPKGEQVVTVEVVTSSEHVDDGTEVSSPSEEDVALEYGLDVNEDES